jgi:aminopeptidase N
MSEIDVDGLYRARRASRACSAKSCSTLDGRLSTGAATDLMNRTRAARPARLRNLALVSYVRRDARVLWALLLRKCNADNLTDRPRRCARSSMRSGSTSRRSDAIADFYTRWSAQKLVIDQWFSVQAACPRAGALARVESLERHTDFDGRNPNRLRALYGAFAGQNPVSFHARDGSGYRFLAERVARIDRANPQIAARLLAPLTRWRRYDAARRAAMKDALRGIEASDAISRDVYEVVTKTLQGEG